MSSPATKTQQTVEHDDKPHILIAIVRSTKLLGAHNHAIETTKLGTGTQSSELNPDHTNVSVNERIICSVMAFDGV